MASAWFGVRYGIDWESVKNYPDISPSSLRTIAQNELEGEDIEPLTNELAERVFRMINEKINPLTRLESGMIDYFNNSSLRLNK